MTDIGIKGLVFKNVTEISDIIKMFIKSSLNVRDGIIKGNKPDICMLSLIRDTYMCNLILRYIGIMTLISQEPEYIKLDNKMIEYIQDYYKNDKFKNKLIELYEYYLKTFEKSKINYDYCRFLDKMINKGEISKKGFELKKIAKMIENRVFNVLSMNPIIKLPTKYFSDVPSHYETKNGKAIVPLSKINYYSLISQIDDIHIRHQIEIQYKSRTHSALTDFSKLIVSRKLLAEQAGHATYFKYINKGKHDNSDTIKEFIIELNNKINKKMYQEIEKIHQFFLRSVTDKQNLKISSTDVIKYILIHKNNNKFEPHKVFKVIFNILNKFFNLNVEQISENGWNKNCIVYNVYDKITKNVLGRLYIDNMFDENKKITDPIAIKLSDKMQINTENKTTPEFALISNYQKSKSMTYQDIVLLFREFGYIINGLCYDSRVGHINYDDEFSNYIPCLMECIAWDRETIHMIVSSLSDYNNVSSKPFSSDPSGSESAIIDHIELSREYDLCYNIKIKCINAKFDHLLHNSEPLLDIIVKAMNTKNDASAEILETYKDIFDEAMSSISNIFITKEEHIDPLTMIQEITTSHGLLYANLMNEIFAYASYWIIKEKLKTPNSTIVSEFRSMILNNGVDNYRELIKNFLKKIDINCFSLYIKNVIKTDSIDDYVTEDTNYFESDHDSDDSDKSDIIQITRI